MTSQATASILVQWGERLFFPNNRIVSPDPTPRLYVSLQERAARVRRCIEATVVRQSPQVIVRVNGGGRGMRAIAAHFRYISRNGQLAIEDDRGVRREGKDDLRNLTEQWRYGGSLIDDVSHRREAFNIVLAIPQGTEAELLMKAARDFARTELGGHRYVMVLHDHQASPHVHVTVRAESMSGERLQLWSRSAHWREAFAERLRERGVEAEATSQASRGQNLNYEPLWRLKAKERGELQTTMPSTKTGKLYIKSRAQALQSWSHIMTALAESPSAQDRNLAEQIAGFVRSSPFFKEIVGHRQREVHALSRAQPGLATRTGPELTRHGPEITR